MTHLLMTADAVGGVWTYALDLARGLVAYGVRTTLAVLGPSPDGSKVARARAVPGLVLRDTGLPLEWLADSPQQVAMAGQALADLAREVRPDVVHLNSPALLAESRFTAPVLAACHSCVSTWWDAVRKGPLPADFAWRTDLLRRGYGRADLLMAPTRAFAAATARAYALPVAPRAVHNGRAAVAAVPAPGLPPHFAFTVGRLWDDAKNLAGFDRAAARLDLPFLAAGPTLAPHGAEVRAAHAHLLGPQDEAGIAAYLAHRPVFVSLAVYEPFGLSVLEAAQNGCPLVLSDIPTFRELWDGAATFVPAHDDAAASRAVAALSADPAEAGERARARAARYTVEATAATTHALYAELLRRRSAA
ncbi:glycosyltransferase [Roseomonas sp. CCTCC AB2023176]|uniref:glycosyltransferase n=1 Tax=Roseomonas sp. CCTCC AB2023176 TaxID=3342640 RepID=UPI0035D7A972